VLYRHKRNSLNRVLALTVAGLILFIIANAYPFLTFRLEAQIQETNLITEAQIQETNLITGVMELYQQGMWIVAGVVLLTTIVMPLLELTGMLFILVPLKLRRRPWKLALLFRAIRALGNDGSFYDRHPGRRRKACQNGQHYPGHRPLCIYGPYFYTCGIGRCA
jgi:paraquat-inducible protein A